MDLQEQKLYFLLALRKLLADYGAEIYGDVQAWNDDSIEYRFTIHGSDECVFEGWRIHQLSVAETYDRIYKAEL